MKTKFLYANGDSFGFGQEIDGPRSKENFYEFTDFQRHHCYSGIIADKFNFEYKNESLPGGSNERIYRTTLITVCEILKKYQANEIFVILSLSNAHRREFYNVEWEKYYPHIPTSKPGSGVNRELWEIMTRNFHSPKSDYIYDQLMLLGLQNFLRINKVPYLMTWSMYHPIIYEDEKTNVPASVMEQRFQRRFYQRPSFSYYVFQECKLERAPGGHPFADGHAAWAEHLLSYINENDLFNNSDLL